MPLTMSSDDWALVLDFCLIFAPLRATMSQKSSLPQPPKSVSQVLMSDSALGRAVDARRHLRGVLHGQGEEQQMVAPDGKPCLDDGTRPLGCKEVWRSGKQGATPHTPGHRLPWRHPSTAAVSASPQAAGQSTTV